MIRCLVGCATRGRRLGSRAVTRPGVGPAPALPQLHTLFLGGGGQLVLAKQPPASLQSAASVKPVAVVDLGKDVGVSTRRFTGWIGGRQAPKQRGEQSGTDRDDKGALHEISFPYLTRRRHLRGFDG